MILKLLTLFLSFSSTTIENDSIITEAEMIGKWRINYCYEKVDSCKNCQKELADLVYVFKKKVFSEVLEDATALVQDRRYGSWTLANNTLIENTTQKLGKKIINYVHEYKLVKINNDKFFVSTIEGNAPLYIYYCRVK